VWELSAILDRLVHNAYRLTLAGPSLRNPEAASAEPGSLDAVGPAANRSSSASRTASAAAVPRSDDAYFENIDN
jgi:hypothetical protein